MSHVFLSLTLGTDCPNVFRMVQNFSEVISLWPSPAVFAKDVGEHIETVRKWRQRNRIPATKWGTLLRAAQAREIPLTSDLLVSIANREAAA
jgi:hypothetical protein